MTLAAVIILWVISAIVQGLRFSTIFQFISTALFAGRFFGVLAKKKTIIGLEVFGLVASYLIPFLRKTIDWKVFFVVLIIRGIYYIIVYYDFKNYMYITKQIVEYIDEEEDNLL